MGLLRPSFRPAAAIAALRAYVRHRQSLVEAAATCIQRMQKALTQMNLQLHHVLSDIAGVTGLAIVRDILAGVRDPRALAAHRDRRCRASEQEIAAALTGNYRAEHLFVLRQNFEAYEFNQRQIAGCDRAIEARLAAWRATASHLKPHCLLRGPVISSARTSRAWSCARRCIASPGAPTSARSTASGLMARSNCSPRSVPT